MTCTARPRLDLDPLRPYLDRIAAYGSAHPAGAAGTAWALARLTGCSLRVAQRANAEGALPEHWGDTAACALGLHPLLLWGDQWEALAEGVAA